ncbi:MAG: hypothetical protein IIY21_25445, partial [Clostridiales bacterium]|nr:hypothetical protein [Clostridiales bacterium]
MAERAYDPNKEYIFTDENGNSFTSKGDNGYVWQAITTGTPITVNSKGEWYVTPYIDRDENGQITEYIPDWFKETGAYNEWKQQTSNISKEYAAQMSLEDLDLLNKYLKQLGGVGVVENNFTNTGTAYGLTGDILKKNVQDKIAIYSELNGEGKASFDVDGVHYDSLEDFGIKYKNMSKEQLSQEYRDANELLAKAAQRQDLYGSYFPITNLVQKNPPENPDAIQQKVANAILKKEALEAINSTKTYDGGAFVNILDSSWTQQWNTFWASYSASLSSNPIANWILSTIGGWMGETRTPQEVFQNFISRDPAAGAYLQGREGAISIGGLVGTAANVYLTVLEMKALQSVLGFAGANIPGPVGSLLQRTGTFKLTFWGAFTADLLLNDIPQDLAQFFTKVSQTGDWNGALYSMWGENVGQKIDTGTFDKYGNRVYETKEGETQKLIPLGIFPTKSDDGIVGVQMGFGPEVPSGLLMDLAGDVIADIGAPFVNFVMRSTPKAIDAVTGGTLSRIHNSLTIKNLQLQTFLGEKTHVGRAWDKILKGFMGAQNFNDMKEAKKLAIARHDITIYMEVANAITAKNHGGSEYVISAFKKLDKKWGVSEAATKFIKEAKKWGGMKNTEVKVTDYKHGDAITRFRKIKNALPEDVKNGLLDIDRLEELTKRDNGLTDSAKKQKEIEALQKRVEELDPQIKAFAQQMSGLNKDLERLGAQLGIKDKDWVEHMVQDPQYANYMTRQQLLPGYGPEDVMRNAKDQKVAAQWRKARGDGYDRSKYVDPLTALYWKVGALGRTVADNEIAKLLSVGQLSKAGAIARGETNIDNVKRIDELKREIMHGTAAKEASGYEKSKENCTGLLKGIGTSVKRVFDSLRNPEDIKLKSVYQSGQNRAVLEHIENFNSGKIRLGDDALKNTTLTNDEAARVVANTYRVDNGTKIERNHPDNVKDFATERNPNLPKYAGVSDNGVPYSYEIEDGKVTSFNEITTPEGMADAATGLGYHLTTEDANKLGKENVAALNRMALAYNSSVPILPFLSGVRIRRSKGRNVPYGWIEGVGNAAEYNYRMENGRINADFNINVDERYYSADNGKKLDAALKSDVQSKWAPANTEDRSSTFIHEMGHSFMQRLLVLDLNRRIENGELKDWGKMVEDLQKMDPEAAKVEIGRKMRSEWNEFHEVRAKQALTDLGIPFNGNTFKKVWKETAATISRYAADETNQRYKRETFSEAFSDYIANGANASPFTSAIMTRLFQEAEQYTKAAVPKDVMAGNGLNTKGLFTKDGEYDFGNAKTTKQKAKWLDDQRQNNPYIPKKGRMTAEQYEKANLWDTYFQKEALSYDKNSKTTIPDRLVEANAKFQEYAQDNSVKLVMTELKKYEADGIGEDVATLFLSRNTDDVNNALENVIAKFVDTEAEKVAKNIDEDVNKVKATMYADDDIVNSVVDMVEEMLPDASRADIAAKVNNLMEDRAKGYASLDSLSMDEKAKLDEIDHLKEQIRKENKKVAKVGKKLNEKMTGDGTHIMKFLEDGQEVYIAVKDPAVASLLQRPDNFKENGVVSDSLVHIGRFFARLYRLGTTGMNPMSIIRNVIRDPMQAMYTAGFDPLSMTLSPAAFYKTLRQFGLDDVTAREVNSRLRDWASGQTMTKSIKEGMNVKGDIRAATYKSKVQGAVRKLDKLTDNKVIDFAEAPLDAWESMLRNQIAQQSFIKTYKKTKNVETAAARAMFDSSNATTNFSHSINKFQRAVSTVPYLTSAVNGTASFWRLFNIDPLGMTTRIVGGFVVPVMAITAYNLSSQDRKDIYMGLPEWWKDGHLLLLGPDGEQIFAFTIPEEIKAFYGLARRFIEYTEDVSPSSLPTILAQGALGLLPGDTDGFVDEYGQWQLGRGLVQYASGLVPQAVNFAYELWAEENLYTGADLSGYDAWNKTINALSNLFGTGIKQVINDIGYMSGASESLMIGKTTANTIARDLFGIGFDNATNQFMNLVGNRAGRNEEGKVVKASGLFKERDELMQQLDTLTRDAAFATEEEQAEIEEKKQYLIESFTNRVATLVNKYMQLYSITGGLEYWQKKKIITLLDLANNTSSAPEGDYRQLSTNQAGIDEYSLARQ